MAVQACVVWTLYWQCCWRQLAELSLNQGAAAPEVYHSRASQQLSMVLGGKRSVSGRLLLQSLPGPAAGHLPLSELTLEQRLLGTFTSLLCSSTPSPALQAQHLQRLPAVPGETGSWFCSSKQSQGTQADHLAIWSLY